MSRRIVDLSHPIQDGMVTYPGIPAPVIGAHLTFDESAAHYAAGTEFSIGTISMAANTGTYLDTPAHRYRDGEDLAGLSLERMVDLDGVVVRARQRSSAGGRAIEESDLISALDGVQLAGRAILIETGHSDQWGTPGYFVDHPYLTDDAVEFLVAAKPSLVGIDSLNIDSTHTGRRRRGEPKPAVRQLIQAGQMLDDRDPGGQQPAVRGSPAGVRRVDVE